jgi:aspartate carbamoyltransferase catalytic subunit
VGTSQASGLDAKSLAKSSTKSAGGSGARKPQHLLGLLGMEPSTVRKLLARAHAFANKDADGSEDPTTWRSILRGKVVANLFFEDSTRTRVSFSLAAQRLGAQVIDLTSMGSSVSKGETVADTALNVAAMGVDALVMRHKSSGAPNLVVRTLEQRVESYDDHGVIPAVINAGDGKHEHPTQGLLDVYTIADRFGKAGASPDRHFDLSGLTVGIVGDIASSRVARSDIAALRMLGAKVICVGPPTLVPAGLKSLGAEISHDLDQVLPTLDAINVLRIQFERHDGGTAPVSSGVPNPASAGGPPATAAAIIASVREYHTIYGLTDQRLAVMKPGALVMHPGPINRGVEMTAHAADSEQSQVLRQVRFGVAVRMAVLERAILGG